MAVFFQIAELSDVPVKTLGVGMSTGGGQFDPANCRACINVPLISLQGDSSTYFETPAFSATDFWLHFSAAPTTNVCTPRNYSTERSICKIYSGSTLLFRITCDYQTIFLERWTGSAWDGLGTYSISYGNIRLIYDLHLTIGASSTATLYINGTVAIVATGLDSTFGGTVSSFTKVVFHTPDLVFESGGFGYSEIAGTDWNTIGCKLVSRYPTANGYYAHWVNGNYTTVDEIGASGDYATSDAGGQRVDWQMTSFPATASNEQIANVQISALLNKDSTGPQGGNFYIRNNSIDYDSPDKTIPFVQGSVIHSYPLDPATLSVWTSTALNSSTYGIRSKD